MSIQIGDLHKKKIVRNMSGDIIDWIDETDGGWIIQKGRVVNQEKLDRYNKQQQDRAEAARAQSMQVSAPVATEERNEAPSRLDKLEKQLNKQDAKLQAILDALKK